MTITKFPVEPLIFCSRLKKSEGKEVDNFHAKWNFIGLLMSVSKTLQKEKREKGNGWKGGLQIERPLKGVIC